MMKKVTTCRLMLNRDSNLYCQTNSKICLVEQKETISFSVFSSSWNSKLVSLSNKSQAILLETFYLSDSVLNSEVLDV